MTSLGTGAEIMPILTLDRYGHVLTLSYGDEITVNITLEVLIWVQIYYIINNIVDSHNI